MTINTGNKGYDSNDENFPLDNRDVPASHELDNERDPDSINGIVKRALGSPQSVSSGSTSLQAKHLDIQNDSSNIVVDLARKYNIIESSERKEIKGKAADAAKRISDLGISAFIDQETLSSKERGALGDYHKIAVLSGKSIYLANYPNKPDQILGRGGDSTVYRVITYQADVAGTNTIKELSMAMKIMNTGTLDLDNRAVSVVEREVELLDELEKAGIKVQKKPYAVFNITLDQEAAATDEPAEIVVGYLTHAYEGNLEDQIATKKLCLEEKGSISKELLVEACKIAEHGLIMRDYKTKNVLIERDDQGIHGVFGDVGDALRISEVDENTDFGICTPGYFTDQDVANYNEVKAQISQETGQEKEEAIEKLTNGLLKKDVFALGVSLFRLLTDGNDPQTSKNKNDKINSKDENVMIKSMLSTLQAPFKNLLCSMLAPDPARRPSFKEIEKAIAGMRSFIVPENDENQLQVLSQMLRSSSPLSKQFLTLPQGMFSVGDSDIRISPLGAIPYTPTQAENTNRVITSINEITMIIPLVKSKLMGEGVYSLVYAVEGVDANENRYPLAFKKAKDSNELFNIHMTQAASEDVINERNKLKELRELGLDFILEPSELIEMKTDEEMITGYFAPLYDGSLKNQISNIPIESKAPLAKELLRQLVVMNKNKIAHFDIKPENILIKNNPASGELNVVIVDWGPSRHFNSTNANVLKDTFKIFSPGFYTRLDTKANSEALKNENTDIARTLLGEASLGRDIFAMGVTLYKLFLGYNRNPYTLKGAAQFQDENIPLDLDATRQELIENGAEIDLANLILKMLDLNPVNRPGGEQIKKVLN